MSNVNKALRKEYETALRDFVQKLSQIRDRSGEDHLLRAQIIVTIAKCVPAVADFAALKESLLKIDSQDRKTLVADCIYEVAKFIENSSPAEGLMAAVLLEELVDLFKK